MDRKSRMFAKLLSVVLVFHPLTAFALDVRSDFNPSILIADATFSDTQTFGGPEGIQRFLLSKQSILANTSPDFLAKLHEPSDASLKQALSDPGFAMGRFRTAAELIWDASRVSGLNPQVILVTLQKEQGLISNSIDPNRVQRALDHAMGFGCPDATGCGNLFPGFYYQLFGNVDIEGNRYLGATKSLMKSFATPNGRGPDIGGVPSKVGDTILIENTVGDYTGILKQQVVTLGNRASAALYRYTPHVFNGNYNFWKFFKSWFKYANGTLLTSSQDGTAFIIQNGLRQRLPLFVATARGLNLASAVAASPIELEDYPLGPTYGPTDNTIVTINGASFVFLDSIMHPASNFVLTQRKLDVTKTLSILSSEASLFTQGSQLTPAEGTVLRGQGASDVYLVKDGLLKLFSPLTLRQYKITKQVQLIPDAEINSYPKQGYVVPLEGTLVRAPSNADAYLVSEGRRLPLTAKIFKNLRFNQKDVIRLSTDTELASIPLGPPAPPREGTYFSITGSPELYLFKGGTKHLITTFVAKQRGITPDYAFDASIVSNWSDGIALAPRDGTLVKNSTSPIIYLVLKGQLHPLTTTLFKNLGFSLKKVVSLSDAEVDLWPVGEYAMPRENTYFTVKETGEFYVLKNGTKKRISPFVATQRGMVADVIFPSIVADGWPLGAPVTPREGTLLKAGTDSKVYLVMQKKLRELSTKAFKRRGYTLKQVKALSKVEVDAFEKGDPIVK